LGANTLAYSFVSVIDEGEKSFVALTPTLKISFEARSKFYPHPYFGGFRIQSKMGYALQNLFRCNFSLFSNKLDQGRGASLRAALQGLPQGILTKGKAQYS
jgi:hypothetical protein